MKKWKNMYFLNIL